MHGTDFLLVGNAEERGGSFFCIAVIRAAGTGESNENSNGLLREFYLKGRNLSRVAPATLKRNLALINARPRKVLNFHSAQELWDVELSSRCT